MRFHRGRQVGRFLLPYLFTGLFILLWFIQGLSEFPNLTIMFHWSWLLLLGALIAAPSGTRTTWTGIALILWGVSVRYFAMRCPFLFCYGFIATIIMLVGLALIIAPFTAGLLATGFARLFFPRDRVKPEPMYGPGEAKRKQGLFGEAYYYFQGLSVRFPEEIRPYLLMMDIACRELHNIELGRQAFDAGMANLTQPEQRETLERLWTEWTQSSKDSHPTEPIRINSDKAK